ncbi:MAG: hypothetical protein WD873_03480 [Candidatus Hydrogenedentales bacterium]
MLPKNVCTVAALCIFAAAAAREARPADLPTPTGPPAVGRTVMYFNDDDRPEPWTQDKNDRRELNLVVWYPAAVGGEPALYVAYTAEKLPPMLNVDRARGGRLTTHAFENPPLAATPARFPVLIFSPGADMAPTAYLGVVQELVSHGFVVVGIDHTYEGKGQMLPDGRLVKPLMDERGPKPGGTPESFNKAFQDFYRFRVEIRVADIASTLHVLALNDTFERSKFYRRLDMERVGVFGHSIGGVAAAHALAELDGLNAGANIDGLFAGVPFQEDHRPSRPFLYLGKDIQTPSAEALKEAGVSAEEAVERVRLQDAKLDDMLGSVNEGAFRVTLPGASHSAFSDEPYLSARPNDSGNEERLVRTRITSDYLHAFFEQSLLGRSSKMLTEVPAEYAGKVEVRSFGRQ